MPFTGLQLTPRSLQNIPRLQSLSPRRLRKIIPARGIQNRPRRVDDDGRVFAPAGAYRGNCIAALRADAGYQEGQGGGNQAHAFNLSRVSCTHHQAELAIEVPGALCQAGDVLIQQGLAINAG